MAADPLSLTFAALADPTRRAILSRLANGQASVGELAMPHDMSLAAVSKHIKVLETAGLIRREKDAQYRYCQLQAGPLKDLDGWMAAYRGLWRDNLDQLDTYLADMQRGDDTNKQ
jgi:DNA-binding transcriptional ArsR family regulator